MESAVKKTTSLTKANANYSGIYILDGRLVFPNSDIFEDMFYEFTEQPLTRLYDFMKPFYKQGFFSLRPPAIYEYDQESVLSQIKERIIKFKNTSNFNNYSNREISDRLDEISFIIPNSIIAAFLNTDGEVQIGKAILKFTDAGVFVIKSSSDYPNLEAYLAEHKISKNLLNPTDENILKAIWETYKEGPLPDVQNIVYHNSGQIRLKKNPSEPWPHSGGSWGNSEDNDPLKGLDDYIATLSPCNTRNSLIGNIFGVYKTCTNHYASRKRVRTDVYNIKIKWNYIIQLEIYSFGVKVKNQTWKGIGFLGLGGWFRKKADVVAIRVPKFHVTYDYSSILTPDNIYNLKPQRVKYSYKPSNTSYIVNTHVWNPGYSTYTLNFSSTYPPYPNFIQDGLVIESIGNNTIDNYINQGNKALTSKELNKLFWETAYSNIVSQMESLSPSYTNPDDMALIANYPNEAKMCIFKTHFDYCTNCRKETEIFGFRGGVGLTLSYNPAKGAFDYSAGAPGAEPVYPEDMRVQMVGAVKVNGVWHGNLLEYNLTAQ